MSLPTDRPAAYYHPGVGCCGTVCPPLATTGLIGRVAAGELKPWRSGLAGENDYANTTCASIHDSIINNFRS